MTRDEAISVLQNAKMAHLPRHNGKTYVSEALDMSIKALSAEPCEDAVSREDMLAELDKWIEAFDEICHKESCADMKLVRKSMELLPPAQPEPQWIPCDKGEPDEDMECWVTVKTTNTLFRGNFTKRYGERRDKGFITSGGFMWWNTALAWMPIYEPEPYKAERREE